MPAQKSPPAIRLVDTPRRCDRRDGLGCDYMETDVTNGKTNAPERMWRETIAQSPMYPDGGSFYHETPAQRTAVEYVRADLVPQWHRIDDPENPPPNDGKRFLAYEELDGYGLYECWYQHDFSNWCGWQDDWDSEPEPTHWMPLPTPPESTQ